METKYCVVEMAACGCLTLSFNYVLADRDSSASNVIKDRDSGPVRGIGLIFLSPLERRV